MIVNLLITGKHTININENGIIKIGDKLINVDKDIPIVRYRFENYGESEIEYIKSLMKKMSRATHLAEVPLRDNTSDILKELPTMAKFVYSEISDDEATNVKLNSTKEELISRLRENKGLIDRVVFKDKTSTMDTVTFSQIVDSVAKLLGMPVGTFAICDSPLSFGERCCLSAVKAREIMSKYSSIADVALPSANHQSMNCCGCVRFIVVDKDTEAVPVKVKKAALSKETKEPKAKAKTVDTRKSTIGIGKFRL